MPEALPGAPAFPAALRSELRAALEALPPGYRPRTRNLRPDGSPSYTNRLILEASPYLRQHAHNPVNWHPWGPEAFEAARRLDRPLLVSVGYSTCHWCHVMEEESFDDPDIARLLNEGFVAVKIDREVRPDIDAVYMSAVRRMRQPGGWPLNVWVTPEGEPFYGGTYFPPDDRAGRRGFPSVLRSIRGVWEADRERIDGTASRIAAEVRRELAGARADASVDLDAAILRRAVAAARASFDPAWGGAGRGRKFPSSFPVRLLLRVHRRTGDADALRMASVTLDKMAAGGIHDQVGGGFHRYATERRWLIPHFEKMLYDNALRTLEYLEAWQATGRADFRAVARRTLEYVAREMTAPAGGFYSATDADSRRPDGEMEEGWFFTWTPDELREALGPEGARLAATAWGVRPGGNLDGRSVLHAWLAPPDLAAELGLAETLLAPRLEAARRRLLAARAARPPPLRDDKILTAWNGLMISAFARAGFAWDDADLVARAERAARFVLEALRSEGRLARAHRDGRVAAPAFLEDYAFLIAGLLDLHEATSATTWLREALALQVVLDRLYADEAGGGYFRTAADAEALLVREKSSEAGAIPSGNAVAAENLLRLAELTGDATFRERALLLFAAFREPLTAARGPGTDLLLAVELLLDSPKEIVVVRPASDDTGLDGLLAPLRRSFVPNRVIVVAREGPGLEERAALLPLLRGRRALGGRVTAYVCENRVCKAPTSDPAVFARQILAVRPLP